MRRLIPVSALAMGILLHSGCGTEYYEESETPAGTPAVQVEPIAPAPVGAEEVPAAPAKDIKELVRTLPPNPSGSGDGLERSRAWKALDWANPAEVAGWKRSEGADDVVLVVRLKGGKRDKAAVSRPVDLALAKTGTLRMDVYNATARTIPVGFAVTASPDRVYSESIQKKASPGWSRVEFDLGANTYKSAASEWEHDVTMWGREDVRELIVLIYDPGTGDVALDRIQADVVEKEPAEAAGAVEEGGVIEEPAGVGGAEEAGVVE